MTQLTDTLPAEPETIETVHDHLEHLWTQACHVSDLDRMAFDTAVIETVSNTIRHGVGDPGPIQVGLDFVATENDLHATIVEFGASEVDLLAEQVAEKEVPDLDDLLPDVMAESGRGLAMIRSLVTLDYERQGATNVWRLHRRTSLAV